MRARSLFATSVLACLTASASLADEVATPVTPEATAPTPERYSFRTSNVLDGKVGLGTLFMRSDPLGVSTGYGQLFVQMDWDGIGGSAFGLHADLDARVLLYEPRDPSIVDVDNKLGNAPPADKDAFYRRPLTFFTGRSYDYLRIDQLYATWDSDAFGVALGRMLIAPAAQAQVDGLRVSLGLGSLGRAGLFAGFKANPWHQQVVGAASGGGVDDGAGQLFNPIWGDVALDTEYGYVTTGPYANELGIGYPWSHLGSLRFVTTGLYGEVRTAPFSVDGALVLDLFDFASLDRVWGYAAGGWRVLDNLTVSFRGTVDVVGARPLSPRDLYLDVSWRELGPLSLQASYFKINTLATAVSYATYFRPLEDPKRVLVDEKTNPWSDDPTALAVSQNLYATNLNNTQLFLVDRDRLSLGAALNLGETLQVYAELLGERRGDVAFVPNLELGQALDGMAQGLGALFAGCSLAANDPIAPKGSNPSVPVYADLCRFGGTLGLRDPFLGGVGSLDLQATWLDGYFQSTTRVSLHVGAALGDVIWLEAGGGLEDNHNHRVYVAADPNGPANTPAFLARATKAYLLDASASWRIWEGLVVEASYFGFLEDVPFQGDTLVYGTADPSPRDQSQYTQMLYARTLYRF